MTLSAKRHIMLEPMISYPHRAQVGKSYLMTIDLRMLTSPDDWPYEDEEYPVSFILDTLPLFRPETMDEEEPTVILHRFGGTYGPASFLLTAAEQEMSGVMHITLVNEWGMPIEQVTVKSEITTEVQSRPEVAARQREVTMPGSAPPTADERNSDAALLVSNDTIPLPQLPEESIAPTTGNMLPLPVPFSYQEQKEEPGTYIGGYRLESLINSGAFFDTHRVRDKAGHTWVLRTPRREWSSQEGLARLQREMHLLRSIYDPHIIRLVDYQESGAQPYSVVEYVEGTPLHAVIRQTRQGLGWQIALLYAQQIAEGLDVLFQHGAIHRDLNPGKISITQAGTARITSFTSSKIRIEAPITDYDEDRMVSDNFSYKSPEYVQSEASVDIRSDLYSLATILFEMFAGHPPFQSENVFDVAIKHINEKRPSICAQRPDLHYKLDTFMQKAMAITPADRYQTPREFIGALERVKEIISLAHGLCPYCGDERAVLGCDHFCLNCGRYLPSKGITLRLGRDAGITCTRCGFLTPAASFCANCGKVQGWEEMMPDELQEHSAASLARQCLNCQDTNWIRPADNFCCTCGIHLGPDTLMITSERSINVFTSSAACPRCEQYTANVQFCSNCGYRLSESYIKLEGADNTQAMPVIEPESDMKRAGDEKCSYCGAETRPGDNYCLNCGNPLLVSQLDLGSVTIPLPPVNELQESCPFCGAETRPGDNFCLNCGNRLLASQLEEQPQRSLGDPTFINPEDWGDPSMLPTITLIGESDAQFQGKVLDVPETTPAALSITIQEPVLGTTIGGFAIMQKIADGAGSLIYLARRSSATFGSPSPSGKVRIPGGDAAIKVPRILHSTSPESRHSINRAFLEEARLLELLHHPHIISLLDYGLSDDGLAYIATEYASGGTLRMRLLRSLIPFEEALQILQEIAEALTYVHQQGIIHRDIKPDNIFFNIRKEALLADFSIAVQRRDSNEGTVKKQGTPWYMAPEQFRGIVSEKSDQYALACVAYELFTGRRPFNDTDYSTVYLKHETAVPQPLRELNPAVPAIVEIAVLKALAKAPDQRFPDVTSFIQALHKRTR